jgi:hypothetical protein
VKHRSVASKSKRNGCVTDRRLVQIEKFGVPSDNLVLKREPIHAGPKIPGVAILAIYRRASEVDLKDLGHNNEYFMSPIESDELSVVTMAMPNSFGSTCARYGMYSIRVITKHFIGLPHHSHDPLGVWSHGAGTLHLR